MGSWNKTCGLSNLHIKAGDPVYVFVLEQQQYHNRCYTTAFWKPILLPFQSTYNDYGSGEKSHGVGLDLIIDMLRNRLVEMELGENKYHDIAVKKSKFDVDLFFNAVQENRLSVDSQSLSTKPIHIDYVMFRKDIIDYILHNKQCKKYVGDGLGNSGEDNCYLQYTFSDVVKDIPKIVEHVKSHLNRSYEDLSVSEKLIPPERWEMKREVFFTDLNMCMKDCSLNLAWMFLQTTNDSGISRIVDIQKTIIDLIARNKMDLATSIIHDSLVGCFVDGFLDITRRHWTPQAHEGSQNQSQKGYLLLNDAISKVLEIERNNEED